MSISGIREYFVPETQRVGNTRIDLYTLERHQRDKQQLEQARLQKSADERVRQNRSANSNLGQNIDIYC